MRSFQSENFGERNISVRGVNDRFSVFVFRPAGAKRCARGSGSPIRPPFHRRPNFWKGVEYWNKKCGLLHRMGHWGTCRIYGFSRSYRHPLPIRKCCRVREMKRFWETGLLSRIMALSPRNLSPMLFVIRIALIIGSSGLHCRQFMLSILPA